jgi:calcineurin-like phosphoesterase family protein
MCPIDKTSIAPELPRACLTIIVSQAFRYNSATWRGFVARPQLRLIGHEQTIGAISDTHGLLRPQALAALADCDPIIHAGDVGSPDVVAKLGGLASVHAVRGNIDHGAWSANLPMTQRIEVDGFRIYVIHILAELNPQAADSADVMAIRTSPRSRQRTAYSFSIRGVPDHAASAYPSLSAA